MITKVFAFFMLLCVFTSYGQNDSIPRNNFGKNEFKLNAIFLLLGAFEPSYERNLSEESSVGISVLIPFDRDDIDMNLNYYVSPYYRLFFGKKYAGGFFLEGFGMLNSIDNRIGYFDINSNYVTQEETSTNFALGFGLGGKWMTTGGFIFEVNGGFGRNLIRGNNNNDNDNENDFVGKFGFNLGYRF